MSGTEGATAALTLLADGEVLDPADALARLRVPAFDAADRVHDWRNYVPTAVRAVWGDLSLQARAAVYLAAEAGASAEDWD